jgi:hypothetical protein
MRRSCRTRAGTTSLRGRAFYERHGFTVEDTNDGSRNMENEPDMTYRWAPSVTNGTGTDQ